MAVSHSATTTLTEVARLHQGIKRIVRGAEQITVEALNAMLKAKCVGEHALGFGASTAELRRFSARLSMLMAELSSSIGKQVTRVATLNRSSRTFRLQQQACRHSRQGRDGLRQIVAEKEVQLAQITAQVLGGDRELRQRLRQAEKLCQIGLANARAAKIEAVYGGDMAPELKHVSDSIETKIEELLQIVKTLGR